MSLYKQPGEGDLYLCSERAVAKLLRDAGHPVPPIDQFQACQSLEEMENCLPAGTPCQLIDLPTCQLTPATLPVAVRIQPPGQHPLHTIIVREATPNQILIEEEDGSLEFMPRKIFERRRVGDSAFLCSPF